ncbi:MAG: DUF3024 domain-containing protein [Bacteroidetes bacterium]|nr:DUF3024 domain-containing protein [Bacteroidota bacterium]
MQTGKIINLFEKEIQTHVEKIRPPATIRKELDIGYSFKSNNLEIFEIRPRWDDENVISHISFAKAQYVKSKSIWKVYWMRASGKWELYSEKPMVKTLREFFKLIEDDEYCCFKG